MDSGAVRQQRYKRHKAGDHSLCRRCDARAAEADPGNAAVARELRATLLALPDGAADGDDDPLAELRALAESVP